MFFHVWSTFMWPHQTSLVGVTVSVSEETYAVKGLFLAVQFHGRGDDSSKGVDVEVLPVPVPCSRLQEGVTHLPIHPFILISRKHLIHYQTWGLLL